MALLSYADQLQKLPPYRHDHARCIFWGLHQAGRYTELTLRWYCTVNHTQEQAWMGWAQAAGILLPSLWKQLSSSLQPSFWVSMYVAFRFNNKVSLKESHFTLPKTISSVLNSYKCWYLNKDEEAKDIEGNFVWGTRNLDLMVFISFYNMYIRSYHHVTLTLFSLPQAADKPFKSMGETGFGSDSYSNGEVCVLCII